MQQRVREQPLEIWYRLVENGQSGQSYALVVSMVVAGTMLRLRTLREVNVENEIVLLVELRLRR